MVLSIDYITKRFDEENFIMSGLFSQNNLLLCGMQGNHALLVKTFKKKSKINCKASRFSLFISAKFAVRAVLKNNIKEFMFIIVLTVL